MIKRSAGLLLFRTTNGFVEIFLVHPGGPFYVKKDLGVWSIPKGEFEAEEPFAPRETPVRGGDRVYDRLRFYSAYRGQQEGGKLVYGGWPSGHRRGEEREQHVFSGMATEKRKGKRIPRIGPCGLFDVETAMQ